MQLAKLTPGDGETIVVIMRCRYGHGVLLVKLCDTAISQKLGNMMVAALTRLAGRRPEDGRACP